MQLCNLWIDTDPWEEKSLWKRQAVFSSVFSLCVSEFQDLRNCVSNYHRSWMAMQTHISVKIIKEI